MKGQERIKVGSNGIPSGFYWLWEDRFGWTVIRVGLDNRFPEDNREYQVIGSEQDRSVKHLAGSVVVRMEPPRNR